MMKIKLLDLYCYSFLWYQYWLYPNIGIIDIVASEEYTFFVIPDRYVILGNHRDAWVFGAIDPSSGTAVMKEVSRVMGNIVKSGK